MKAFVRTVGCPGCGGALVLGPASRVVRCPYCAALKLVLLERVLPRYVLRVRVAEEGARAALVAALAHPALLPGLDRAARLAAPRLLLVPFYEHRARRLGRALLERVNYQVAGERAELESGSARGHKIISIRKETTPDTKVVLATRSFHWPAVELPGLGIEHLDPVGARRRDGIHVDRYDAAGVAHNAIAFEPTVDIESFRGTLHQGASRQSDVRAVEEHVQVLYYPVWRLGYVHRGCSFRAAVDGLDGSVLRLEGPPSPVVEARRLVGLAALAGGAGAIIARLGLGLSTLDPEATVGGYVLVALTAAAAACAARSAFPRISAGTMAVLERRAGGLEATR